MVKPCKKGKGCLEDICGKKYTYDDSPPESSIEHIQTEEESRAPALTEKKVQISTAQIGHRTQRSMENGDAVRLKNPNVSLDSEDILYHLALGNKSHDLVEMFGDIKFVCMGGTPHRMERFAYYILQEIGYRIPPGTMLQDISIHSHRYAMFKVGPVISVSHGMGMPSVGILLHELIKLMYHARVKDPIFFRLGTCGGLGLEPGSVVVTTEPLNGSLDPVHVVPILGKRVERPAILDQELADEITKLVEPSDNFRIAKGKTMCTDDFYEGQGRLDGAFCHYTEEDKFKFLKLAREKGVSNIEMESVAMAAITHHVGIKCAIICVTLLDRLAGDQINQTKKTLEEWQDRPMVIAGRYIKKYLSEHGEVMAKIESRPRHKKSIACPDCVSLQKSKFGSGAGGGGAHSKDDDSAESGTESSSSQSSSPSSTKSDLYGCLPGCSIVVSSSAHLKRVLDESSGVD